jgi:hypothetical protein
MHRAQFKDWCDGTEDLRDMTVTKPWMFDL